MIFTHHYNFIGTRVVFFGDVRKKTLPQRVFYSKSDPGFAFRHKEYSFFIMTQAKLNIKRGELLK